MIRHGDTIVIPARPLAAEAATTAAGRFRCGRCRVMVANLDEHDDLACDLFVADRAKKNED